MQNSKAIQFVLILATLFGGTALVQAAPNYSDYEEVSYDDLVNELNAKKTFLRRQNDPVNNTRMYLGVGYANAFTNISAQKQNFNRHTSGVQLSVGMDLMSPQWFTEGVFRNYGVSASGNEELTLRELDLKIGYTNRLESIWSYVLSTGLSNRFMRFTDSSKNIDVDEMTPSLSVSTGFFAQVHKRVSLGAEVSAKTAIVNRTSDKNSFDFAFRLNTSL